MPKKPKKISEGGKMPATLFKPGHSIRNPSKFTDEIGERILDLLWSGKCKSLEEVLRYEGMPCRRTLYNWAKTFPSFGSELMEARIALGGVYADEIEDIKQRMLDGKLDPSAANVAIKSNQWKAQITDPRTYANKSYVEKNQTVSVTSTYVQKIDIEGLDDDQLDAIELALNAKLLTGPDDGNTTTQ